jgi:hypothetical protein
MKRKRGNRMSNENPHTQAIEELKGVRHAFNLKVVVMADLHLPVKEEETKDE